MELRITNFSLVFTRCTCDLPIPGRIEDEGPRVTDMWHWTSPLLFLSVSRVRCKSTLTWPPKNHFGAHQSSPRSNICLEEHHKQCMIFIVFYCFCLLNIFWASLALNKDKFHFPLLRLLVTGQKPSVNFGRLTCFFCCTAGGCLYPWTWKCLASIWVHWWLSQMQNVGVGPQRTTTTWTF